MKVLLVNPIRRGGDSYCTPPLHLMYVSKAIREAGHESEIYDAFFIANRRGILNDVLNKEEYEQKLINEILEKDFDLLGIGSIVSSYPFSENLVKQAKNRKDVPIIIGGGLGTPILDLWEKNTEVDFVVASDGEKVIHRFLENYPDRDKIQKIPGLYYREDGKFIKNKPELNRNLDYISYPDWNEVDYEAFITIQRNWVNSTLPKELKLTEKDRVLPIVATRGCPYDCTFCYHFDRTHRKHSIDYIIKYLTHLKESYGINVLQTWDDLIMTDRKWFMELCDEIAARNMGFRIFSGGGKPNFVTKEMLDKMRKAGFIRISYGIESGSQKILNIMKKKITVSQNYSAMKMTTESGIFPHANIVLGMPGETRETLKETKKFLESLELEPKHVSFAFATAYPGTELFTYLTGKYNVTDLKAYLENVTGVGQHQYNFTEMSKYTLVSYPSKILYALELKQLKRQKKHLRYFLSFFTKGIFF